MCIEVVKRIIVTDYYFYIRFHGKYQKHLLFLKHCMKDGLRTMDTAL